MFLRSGRSTNPAVRSRSNSTDRMQNSPFNGIDGLGLQSSPQLNSNAGHRPLLDSPSPLAGPPILSPHAGASSIPNPSSSNFIMPPVLGPNVNLMPPPVHKLTAFLPSIPFYDGSGESLDAFFDGLERVSDYAHWTESDKVFALSLKLKGEAAQYYQENLVKKGIHEYLPLKRALEYRFKKKELPRQILRRLSLAYQTPNESVREYASRLEALSFKAFSSEMRNSLGGETARNETLMGAFVDGLKPSLRRVVHHMSPRTFEEAVRISIEEEELFGTPSPYAVPAENPVNTVTSPEQCSFTAEQNMIAKLTETVSNLSRKLDSLTINRDSSRNSNTQSREARTCYRCNRVGHIQRNCPDRQRNGQATTNNRGQGNE